jgi:hypothetical protein
VAGGPAWVAGGLAWVAGGEVEFLELIHGARGGVNDVEQALVSANLELFSGLLVDVNRTVDADLLDAGRKRDRAGNAGAGALCRFDDLLGRAIYGTMIEGAEADADLLLFHDGGGVRVDVVVG